MQNIVTASSVLFGFLFAGFWWSLNRELKFEAPMRHFKYGYILLVAGMSIVAVFGILIPLRTATRTDPTLTTPFYGISLGMICIFGYILTEYGHYRIFQKPKYATKSEKILFWLTVIAVVCTGYWLFR